MSKRGYVELVTQMYFPEEPLNDVDLLLQRKGKEEQKLMIAELVKSDPTTYSYKLVLQSA